MSEFVTSFVIEGKKGSDGIWILRNPLIYRSDLAGRITIPMGFETDLASVPRVPFVYSLWGGRAHREAVVHDYLFRLDASPEVPFSIANKVFLEAMWARQKPSYIRWPMYWGVCLGARSCWHRRYVNAVL